MNGEWPGSTSAKFTTNKRHTAGNTDNNQGKHHPLFAMGGKTHYDGAYKLSGEQKWSSSVRTFADKERERPNRAEGTKYLGVQDSASRANGKYERERRHMDVNAQTKTFYEENPISKAPFTCHNRKTQGEQVVEKTMGGKDRIRTMYDQRNGCNLVALGDKIYKSPEFSTGFFHDGGLITGST